MLTKLRSIPWWVWVAVVLVFVFLFNIAGAQNYSRKLFNMALDQLREDQSNVVATLEENQKMYEAEIVRLSNELQAVKQRQAVAKAETERLKGVVREKDIQIAALKKERDAIVIPNDVNALADEFRKRGYSPRVIISR